MDEAEIARNLKAYKYIGPNLSLCEKLFLDKFWTWWASNIWPDWLAPNLVTFVGFLPVLGVYALLLCLSPDLDGSTGGGWCVLAAVCTWWYQTCDGSDGKQARRIKAGSPLGEIFDHGVDALVTAILLFFTVEMIGVSNRVGVFMLGAFGAQSAFYTSNLTLLHQGKQHFNTVDAQEFQVVLQVLLLVTATFGRSLFEAVVPVPAAILGAVEKLPEFIRQGAVQPGGLDLIWIFIVINVVFVHSNLVHAVVSIVRSYSQKDEGGKVLDEGRGLPALANQMLALTALHCSAGAAWVFAAQDTSDPYVMVSWMLTMQFGFGYLMNCTLVTRVAKTPCPHPLFNPALACNVALLVVNVAASAEAIPEPICIFARLCVANAAIVNHLRYSCSMGQLMARLLGIKIFSVKGKI